MFCKVRNYKQNFTTATLPRLQKHVFFNAIKILQHYVVAPPLEKAPLAVAVRWKQESWTDKAIRLKNIISPRLHSSRHRVALDNDGLMFQDSNHYTIFYV